MLLVQLGILAALLPLCSVAPGFFCLRRFRLSPFEKLTGSIGLSLILVYVASWVIYCVTRTLGNGAELQRDGFLAITGISGLMAIAVRRELAALFRIGRVRRAIAGFAALLLWTFLILAMIRNYSGLGWGTDWLEHFQRALFFIHHFPPNTPGVDLVPSRPPMMNVLSAFFLAQSADEFAPFQMVSAYLNLLPFLACVPMLPALGPKGRWRILPLVALYAFNPLAMENATYTWTKAFTAFFILLSFWFFLAARRKRDGFRFVLAFLFAAAGLLVHYSAGPYVVFLAVYYLVAEFPRRPRRWRELAAIATVCATLLSTWFLWSIATYGFTTTFQSNTPIRYSREYKGNNLVKMGANIVDSIVPWPVRDWSVLTEFSQPNRDGLVRDAAFAAYQTNLIVGMGAIGGWLVVWLLFGLYRRPPKSADWRFWRVAIPACVLGGLAVVGERDRFGTAHLTLIPMELLGITLLASVYPWRKMVAGLALAGCLFDFSAGVLLQAHVESFENTPGHAIFSAGIDPGTLAFGLGPRTPEGLSIPASTSWFVKHKYALALQYKTALLQMPAQDANSAALYQRAAARLDQALGEDQLHFLGWWSRHNYQIQFLGDEVAEEVGIGPEPIEAVLITGCLSLTGFLAFGWLRKKTAATPSKARTRSARPGATAL